MTSLSDAPRMVAVRFLVEADTSPGLLPRLLQPFAKRDLTPDCLWSTRLGETMQIGITLKALDAAIVHVIEGNLRQVIGVRGLTRAQSDNLRAAACPIPPDLSQFLPHTHWDTLGQVGHATIRQIY